MNRRYFLNLAAAALTLTACSAFAQSHKPVSLVVGFGAGGTADFVARTVAHEMTKTLGRPVIVENVPGASGMLAAQKLINGAADGSMIYLGGTDTVVIPMLNKKLKVDWEKDFQIIGRSGFASMVFAVNSKSPYNSMSDVFAAVRQGKNFSYATAGVGTMQHLFGEMINLTAKVAMVPVPYKGGAQMVTDVLGGHIDSAILTTTSSMAFLKEGSIKALSVAESERLPSLPNVKAIGEEEGFSAMSLPLWHAFFIKAGTPPSIVAAYEKALLSALESPTVQTKFKDAGVTPAPLDGASMTAYVGQQSQIFKGIIAAAKISME